MRDRNKQPQLSSCTKTERMSLDTYDAVLKETKKIRKFPMFSSVPNTITKYFCETYLKSLIISKE